MNDAIFYVTTAAALIASVAVAGFWLLASQVDEQLHGLDLNDDLSFEIRPWGRAPGTSVAVIARVGAGAG